MLFPRFHCQWVLERHIKRQVMFGSVTGTCRYAQAAAVGFNRKKKGQRSYYPLLSTVSQTAQVLDVLHRSGNVHDSNGSLEFIGNTLEQVRLKLPNAHFKVYLPYV